MNIHYIVKSLTGATAESKTPALGEHHDFSVSEPKNTLLSETRIFNFIDDGVMPTRIQASLAAVGPRSS